MRVLQVVDYYWPAIEWGGPVRSVRLLARALSIAGVEVEVLTTSTRGEAMLPPPPEGEAEIDGLRVTYCRAFGPRRYFFSPALLRQLLSARRFDIVHLHGLWTASTTLGSRLCRAVGVPYVLSPRGSLDPWALGQKAWKKGIYMSLLERRTLSQAGLLHFTSLAERASAPSPWSRAPSAVVPNAVMIDSFAAVPPCIATAELKLLLVGRLHKMKGFDVLVPALAELGRRGVPYSMRVVGPDEGGYREQLLQLAARHGVRLDLLGLVEPGALPEHFAWCDMLVMPSYRENFGNAAAEAMAAGRPVVVSTGVNIAAEIEAFGAGLVLPLEPLAWAAALAALATNSEHRASMGARGRTLVQECFLPAAVGRAMSEAYSRLLESRA